MCYAVDGKHIMGPVGFWMGTFARSPSKAEARTRSPKTVVECEDESYNNKSPYYNVVTWLLGRKPGILAAILIPWNV